MFSSSKRLERGLRVLVRIITFLLQPFERKIENMYIFFIYGDKIFHLGYIFSIQKTFKEVFYL